MKGNTLELRRQDKAARVPKDLSDFTGKLRSTDPVGGLGFGVSVQPARDPTNNGCFFAPEGMCFEFPTSG